MEKQETSAKSIVLNYGLLLGILSVVLGAILYVTNAYLEPSIFYTAIGFLLQVALIYLGIKSFKGDNGGFLSIREALKVGLGISVVAGVIIAIWSLILMNFLEPDFMAQMAEIQEEQMLERYPNMTEAQRNQTMEINQKMRSPWITAAFSLVGNLFTGFLIALVTGAIMKRKRPYED